MDYEKKYNEALEKARQLCAYPTTTPFISDLQDLFPELAESEDEKIRKAIVNAIHNYAYRLEEKIPTEWLTWLEKQGEQKPLGYVHHIDEDGYYTKEAILEPNPYTGTGFDYNGHHWGMCARDGGVEITIDGNIADRVFPKDGKPVWSEEDEENYQHACFAIRNACRSVGLYTLEDKKDLEDWLNSLKQKIKKGG